MNKLADWLNSFAKNEDSSINPRLSKLPDLTAKKPEQTKSNDPRPQKGFSKGNFKGGPRFNRGGQRSGGQDRRPAPNTGPGGVVQAVKPRNPAETLHFEKGSILKITPIGGVDETGNCNCTIVEYKDDILIVDAGLGFPEGEHPGVDYLIPNINFLKPRKDKIRGILITHGHLDHIGALPHFLQELNFPVIYASRYALALIRHRLKEFDLENKAKLVEVPIRKNFKFGASMEAEWVHINHSLPDARSIFLRTPEGNVFFSGDFKIDYTPEKEEPADFETLTRLKKEGVDLLLSDSLGVANAGHVPSERVIRQSFDNLFKENQGKGRILIGLTASNSNRFQQIIDSAAKYGRKVGVVGRSLETNLRITSELGYLKEARGVLIPPERLSKLPDSKVTFLVTGSQGEEFAALNRISQGLHKDIQIQQGDIIVFSASEIPGNERAIAATRNRLTRQGAVIINDAVLTVHSSGHGCAEDKRLLLVLLQPKYFMPYHGEYYFRYIHAQIARETGVEDKDIFFVDDGMTVEMYKHKARISAETIPADKLIVDGNTVSSQEGSALLERKILGQDGVVIILFKRNSTDGALFGHPKIISRGFLFEAELQKLHEDFSIFAKKTYEDIIAGNAQTQAKTGDKDLIHLLSKAMGKYIRKQTEREPIVMPILINNFQ